MSIRILCIGKKNESWVEEGIERFLKRLKPPFRAKFEILPHSGREGEAAINEESERLQKRLSEGDTVILLDERGKNLASPEFARFIERQPHSRIVIIIGGAYGVSENLRQRANLVWSLSRLVFPHQLVRLILTEQLYRAQEITRGGQYHHD